MKAGDRRQIDAWLEDSTDPEVIAYLKSENAFTEAVMAPAAALGETRSISHSRPCRLWMRSTRTAGC